MMKRSNFLLAFQIQKSSKISIYFRKNIHKLIYNKITNNTNRIKLIQ